MKYKIYIILIIALFIIQGCSSKAKSEILSEKLIEITDDDNSIECKKITYSSDGLEIVGYLVKPKNINGKLPVIIYNRGGHREFGKITDELAIKYLGYLASKGYVVFAPQYRGNDGGEGKEQFGGNDLNDVLNLIELAKNQPYVNKKQIFMIGGSRGGMMTYMACRESKDIKAAVVIAGMSDAIQSYNDRGDMRNVFIELIGGTPEEKEEEYMKRSAYYWAEKIDVPLLILHGGIRDWRVKTSQSEKMAKELKKYNKNYKLIIYPNEDHKMLSNVEANKEIFEWFDKYKNN